MAITVALFLIAFICTHHTSQLLVSSTYCPATERQALAELKTSTIDPAGRLSSWSGTDCCQWDGVRCDNQTGHVVGIVLRNLHVYKPDFFRYVMVNSSWALEFGLLSPSLLSLNHLLHLDLSGNYFKFPAIPQFLGSFKDLRYLNLSNTNMNGTIPHQLGNLSTLHTLSLLVNYGFDGLKSLALDDPRWISGLTSLQHFEIRFASLGRGMIQALNMLSSLRQIRVSGSTVDAGDSQSLSLVNFTSLEVLVLRGNEGLTSAILSWLPNLTHLQHLDLSNNGIQGFLPIANWNISSLEVIDMSRNDFTGNLPEIAGNLRRLQRLDLSRCSLTGRLPFSIGNMASLEYLDLSLNSISGAIPASIGNLTQLRELYLDGNILKGQIPESIGQLHRLLWLDLSSNTLPGPIPVSITNLSRLEHLVLLGNSFNGSIPRSLWRLSLLQELDLSDNRLTGTIPQSLWQLSNLGHLDLSANRLTGTIPQSLRQLSNLVQLDLSNNSLVGVVTESHFASLAKLRLLSMSHNSMLDLKIISGWRPPFNLSWLSLAGCRVGPQFPGWLRSQRDITYLDLSNANISDSLPDWLWGKVSVSGLACLLLSNNNLTGTIPTSFCEVNLSVLDVSGNHLTGQLPNCSIDVTILDVSNNSLSGDIPDAFLNSTGFESLYLHSNSFTGEVPTILKQSKGMSVLDLGNNRFRGNVPVWLDESFTSLHVLRLSSNMLTGSLPTETLSRIPNLQVLDLSHNNLSGVIPKSFGNLTAMMRQNEQWYDTLEIQISTNDDSIDTSVYYTDKVSLDIKGRDLEYSNSLQFLAAIDLSDNNLSGAIPEELGNLSWLQSLNVSGNCLTGEITAIIGGMQRLESLDLSRNKFSGPLPQSLANLNSLEVLNVSYNNFSGRIPSGGHIDTFFDDPSVYMGNPNLYNVSLAENNHGNQTNRGENEEDDNNKDEIFWLYAGLTPGFAVGLCILYGVLAFKETWRRAYFQTVDRVCDFLYVKAVIHLRKLKRTARVHD